MNVLNLILQKKFAKEIIRGEKVREYRDYTDFYATKLIDFTNISDSTIHLESGTHFTPRHFDAIKFYWYSKEYLLVELLGWSVLTIDKAKSYTPDAICRDCKRWVAKSGEKTLYDVIIERDEYDLAGMPEDIPFFCFQLGKVIENHTNIVKLKIKNYGRKKKSME
jgi:hypothetical protein